MCKWFRRLFRKKSETALKEMLTLFLFAIAVLREFCDPDLQISFLNFFFQFAIMSRNNCLRVHICSPECRVPTRSPLA